MLKMIEEFIKHHRCVSSGGQGNNYPCPEFPCQHLKELMELRTYCLDQLRSILDQTTTTT